MSSSSFSRMISYRINILSEMTLTSRSPRKMILNLWRFYCDVYVSWGQTKPSSMAMSAQCFKHWIWNTHVYKHMMKCVCISVNKFQIYYMCVLQNLNIYICMYFLLFFKILNAFQIWSSCWVCIYGLHPHRSCLYTYTCTCCFKSIACHFIILLHDIRDG